MWFSLLVNVKSLQKSKKRMSHYLTVDLLNEFILEAHESI